MFKTISTNRGGLLIKTLNKQSIPVTISQSVSSRSYTNGIKGNAKRPIQIAKFQMPLSNRKFSTSNNEDGEKDNIQPAKEQENEPVSEQNAPAEEVAQEEAIQSSTQDQVAEEPIQVAESVDQNAKEAAQEAQPEEQASEQVKVVPDSVKENLKKIKEQIVVQPAEEKAPARTLPDDYDFGEQFPHSKIGFTNSKLAEQRYLRMTSLELAEKSVPILDLDIPKMKTLANEEFTKEKESYLQELKNKQKELKENANQRIFSMIDGEFKAARDLEEKFLESQIKRREVGASEHDERVDKQDSILGIYKSYAKLETVYEMPTLKKLVSEFDKQNEKVKRQIFETIKIGYAKEMAKVQIYKNDLIDKRGEEDKHLSNDFNLFPADYKAKEKENAAIIDEMKPYVTEDKWSERNREEGKDGRVQSVEEIYGLQRVDRYNPQRVQKITEACLERAQTYQIMLKRILPQEFSQEFESLQQIQDKITNVDKTFQDAQEKMNAHIAKIQEVQETLKKHPDHLDPKKAKDQLHLSILEDKDDISLLSPKEFKEKFDALIDVKKAIDSISIAEITEQDKQLEIQNNDFHMNEEYDAVQTMHLFALLHQHENQVRQELFHKMHGTKKRNEFLNNKVAPQELIISKPDKVHDPKAEGLTNLEYAKKHGLEYDLNREMFLNEKQQKQIQVWEKEQTMDVNYKGRPPGFNKFTEHKEFLQLLKKNKIDPVWIKNKTLTQYTKRIEEKRAQLQEKAEEIEDNLLTSQHSDLMNMIMKKTSSKDLQKYLLAQLRKESLLSESTAEQNILNDMVIANVEKLIKEGPQGVVDFDSTSYIMQKLHKQEEKAKKYSRPVRTIFDEMNPNERAYEPANAKDRKIHQDIKQHETLTYDNYVYKQKEKLNNMRIDEEEKRGIKGANDQKFSLIHSMSLAKRNAWLEIYNDYLAAIEPQASQNAEIDQNDIKYYKGIKSQEQFYDMFRNWEFKLLPEGKYPHLEAFGKQQRVKEELRAKALVEGHGSAATAEAYSEIPADKIFNDIKQQVLDEAIAVQDIRVDDVHKIGFDKDRDLKEHLREQVLSQPRSIAQALDLSSEDEHVEIFEQSLEASAREDINSRIQQVKEMGDAFKAKYGHEAWEKTTYELSILQVDHIGFQQPTQNEYFPEYLDLKQPLKSFNDMELLDNAMVRRIEMHLKEPHLRLPRISEQFEAKTYGGVSQNDNIYNEQYFDYEGIKAKNKQSKLDNMSPKEQQNILTYKMNLKQQQISEALEQRQEDMMARLDLKTREQAEREVLKQMKHHRSKKSDKNSPETVEDVKLRLKQIEKEVRDRIMAEQAMLQGQEEAHKNQFSPEVRLMQQIGIESHRLNESPLIAEGNVLQEFVQNDVFNQHSSAESANDQEWRMMQLAYQFNKFDLKYILGQKDLDYPLYTSGAYEPIGTQEILSTAQTAEQIKLAASKQSLSPQEAELSKLYDPANPLNEQYLRSKFQMFTNKRLREDFAASLLEAQELMEEVNYQRNRFEVFSDNQVKRFATDVSPKPAYNFIQMEENVIAQADTGSQMLNLVERLQSFDPNSKDTQNYNDELKFQLGLTGSSPTPEFYKQYDFITQQMDLNSVKPNSETRALFFQKSVLCEQLDLANLNIKKINDGYQISTQLRVDNLQKFFEQSLKRDNFDGLAHLAAYVEKNHISTKNWDITSFRSALDFYLNHTFDLNKILTFVRFYILHANSCIGSQEVQDKYGDLANLNQEQKVALFQDVFGDLEGLVDINELFSHLVEKIGTKTFIDPKTKQDPLQNLINMFANPEIQTISKLSQEGTTFLSSQDVAKYMINHLDSTHSFKQLSHLILTHDQSSDDSLATATLSAIRNYHAKNKSLPASFNAANARQLYLSLTSSDIKISEKTADYLLFLFKSCGMQAEAIDLCNTYQNRVKGYSTEEQASKSDIRNYYMSDSLLGMGLGDQRYNEVIEKAVFDGSSKESASYLNSMTKAYFKDGNAEHALKFFEGGIQQRRKQREDQDEALVKLYDASFAETNDKPYDIQAFKEKYLNLMVVREKMKKEVKAVHLLDELLQRCDPEEVDNIFLLQIVLKEEKALLQQIADFNNKDFVHIYNHYNQITDLNNLDAFVNHFKEAVVEGPDLLKLAKAQAQVANLADGPQGLDQIENVFSQGHSDSNYKAIRDLQGVRQRREVLESSVQFQSKEKLLDLMSFVGDDQVEFFGETRSLEEAVQALGVSQEEFKDVKSFQDASGFNKDVIKIMKLEYGVGDDLQDVQQKAFLSAFQSGYDSSVKEQIAMQDKEDDELHIFPYPFPNSLRTFEEKSGVDVDTLLDQAMMENPDRPMNNPRLDSEDKEWIQKYKDEIYETAPDLEKDTNEADVMRFNTYSELVGSYGNELQNSVTQRREKVFEYAIKTFNKIQGQKSPQWFENKGEFNLEANPEVPTLGDIAAAGEQEFNIDNIPNSSQKLREMGMNKSQFKPKQGEDPLTILSDAQLDAQELNAQFGHQVKNPQVINRTIDRFNFLLNEKESPLISNFMNLLDYQDGRDMEAFDSFSERTNSQKEELFDKYTRQAQQLIDLTGSVKQMTSAMNNTSNQIRQIINQFEEEASQANQFYRKWSDNKDQKVSNVVEGQVKKLYSQFVREQGMVADQAYLMSGNKNSDQEVKLEFEQSEQQSSTKELTSQSLYPQSLSKEQKVKMMQQALSLEGGSGFKPVDVYNKFYAEDLIVFGMQNNIPEAVRLGEHMLGENGESLSYDMAKAVKSYQANHNVKYQEAMKATGPINTSSVYKNSRPDSTSGSAAYTRSSIVNMDDPYWQQFYEKNYRIQDQYKLPSVHAFEHKEYGIISEILDMKKIDQNLKEAKQMGL